MLNPLVGHANMALTFDGHWDKYEIKKQLIPLKLWFYVSRHNKSRSMVLDKNTYFKLHGLFMLITLGI